MACLDITSTPPSGLSVRPLQPSDRESYLRAFERLSPETRYARFAGAKPALSSAEVRYLVEVDHHAHEALVAYDRDGDVAAVGRYVGLSDDPTTAEVAITVADHWQGQGLGPRLLELIVCRAREEGFSRLVATVLPGNRRAVRALAKAGFGSPRYADGFIHLHTDIATREGAAA